MPVYVFIPNPFPGGYIFGTQRCKGPVDSQTFIGADLPNANEIVALKADRGTCREQDIDRERDQFQPPFVDVAKAVEGCQVEWHEPNAQVLQAGSKLRILGYRTFVGHHSQLWPAVNLPNLNYKVAAEVKTNPQQLLFALVAVESRP
jgi:hypothetical protein